MRDDPEWTRFLSNVRRSVRRPDECWPWSGYYNPVTGYPMVTTNGKSQGAYRAVWELLVGPIPDGLELDHLCVNPPCVNPHHLEPVTPLENKRRSESPAARAARATHCKHGHPWDIDNTGWRINKSSGLPSRVCRACKRIAMRRYATSEPTPDPTQRAM